MTLKCGCELRMFVTYYDREIFETVSEIFEAQKSALLNFTCTYWAAAAAPR
eukprot:SAG11_NODE_14724_length_602_cov_0.604374_1_plen_50_part_10